MCRALARGLPRVDLRSLANERGRAALLVMGIGAFILLGSFGLFDWITPLRAIGLTAVVLGAAALLRLHGSEVRR